MIVIPRSHSRFAQFRVLIFNFGYKKFWNDLYCCNFMYWAFSPVMGPSQNLNFLIIYFDSHNTWSRCSLWLWNGTISKLIFLIIYFDFRTSSRRGLWSVFVLRESVVDFNWRISCAYIGVSSAVYPALIALERVRSDSLGSLSWWALSFAQQTTIPLM